MDSCLRRNDNPVASGNKNAPVASNGAKQNWIPEQVRNDPRTTLGSGQKWPLNHVGFRASRKESRDVGMVLGRGLPPNQVGASTFLTEKRKKYAYFSPVCKKNGE